MDDNLPSDNESVYLTTIYDRYYMKRAVDYHQGAPIVVEVIVQKRSLRADEGQLSRAALASNSDTDALYLSMCAGACKHNGPIPVECILSISDAEGNRLSGET